MTEWFSGLMADAAEHPVRAVLIVLLLVSFLVQVFGSRVRDLFDPVVKREYGHVVAVDLAVDKNARWKGNDEPLQNRKVARLPSGEELLFSWCDAAIGLPGDIKRQVFAGDGHLINLYEPKINADPATQQAAIAQMKDKYFRFWLPQPKAVVIVRRKSGRFRGTF